MRLSYWAYLLSQVFTVNVKQASFIANTKCNMDFLSKEHNDPFLINKCLECKREFWCQNGYLCLKALECKN